jgi:hypothetical protein
MTTTVIPGQPPAAVDGTLPTIANAGHGRGSDPELLADELLYYIGHFIDRQPRSLQQRIGPSEIGTPCTRKLGYKLAGTPIVNHRREPAWKPAVGTSVHAFLELAMTAPATEGRFLVEQEVTVGEIGGIPISGHCDCYDLITDTVIDWKCVGPEQLKKYRSRKHPGDQYRTQAHLYGRGWHEQNRAHDPAAPGPATVMIVFLPRNGELRDAYAWHEPYQEQVAIDALSRAETVSALLALGGAEALPVLGTADDYCTGCPFYRPGSTDPRIACPGHPARPTRTEQPALSLTTS